jgi:hypothetical protein
MANSPPFSNYCRIRLRLQAWILRQAHSPIFCILSGLLVGMACCQTFFCL